MVETEDVCYAEGCEGDLDYQIDFQNRVTGETMKLFACHEHMQRVFHTIIHTFARRPPHD